MTLNHIKPLLPSILGAFFLAFFFCGCESQVGEEFTPSFGDYETEDESELLSDGDMEIDAEMGEDEAMETEALEEGELGEDEELTEGDSETQDTPENDQEEEEEEEEIVEREPEVIPEWDYEIPPLEDCVPGERVCFANKLKICNDDGHSWTRMLCEENQICNLDGCVDVICTPSETTCDGSHVMACNAEGTDWGVFEVCRPPKSCSDGACKNVCNDAETIAFGQTIEGDTRRSTNGVAASTACWSDTEGVMTVGYDDVYEIELERGQAIHATVTPNTRHFDSAIYLFNDCASMPKGCITGADTCCSFEPDELHYTVARSGTYYLAVDSWEATGGEYTLQIEETTPVSVDLSVGGLHSQYSQEDDELFIFADIINESEMAAQDVAVGVYLFHAESPQSGDLPDKQAVYQTLEPNQGETAAFRFPKPPKGDYAVWVVADWNQALYDTNLENNVAGVHEFTITDGVDEWRIEPPESVGGRVQGIGEESYYRILCEKGRVMIVDIAVESSISMLDPIITLFAADDETMLETVNENGAGEGEQLRHICRADERVRMMVTGVGDDIDAEGAIGSFTFSAQMMSELSVLPRAVSLFPNGKVQLNPYALFLPLLPEAKLDVNDLCTFTSLDPDIASISQTGLIEAQTNERRTTFIIVDISDPTIQSVPVQVDVTNLIPGEIFPTIDPMPLEIPDANSNGVLSGALVEEELTIESLAVGVSITHPDVDELTLNLISPSGREIRLYEQSLQGQNLFTVFGVLLDVDGPGHLTDFTGEDAEGVWYLHVIDSVRSNAGRINNWRLYIVEAAPIEE